MPRTRETGLSLQEESIAYTMHARNGRALVNFTIENGQRVYQNPELSSRAFNQLISDFRQDPKDSLAWARQALFNLAGDKRLSEKSRKRRLNRYLDAYFNLQLKLDRNAFPETPYGQVIRGTPDYVPDGLVDMGSDPTLDSRKRFDRERIHVDKRTVLEKYKDVFERVFSADTSGMSSTDVKRKIVSTVLYEVYNRMPYDRSEAYKKQQSKGFSIDIGQIMQGVCRHHALVTQVLLQAFGITSRLFKNDVYNDGYGGAHASNLVRIDSQWYIADATQPLMSADGTWRPALLAIDGKPDNSGRQTFTFKVYRPGGRVGSRTYTSRDNMYWTIEHGPRGRYRTEVLDY